MSHEDEVAKTVAGVHKTRKVKQGRPALIPKTDETYKAIEGMGRFQATRKEMAAMFGVCIRTFENFMRINKKAREAYERGSSTGIMSLRRTQYNKAMEGNTTMMIWLGKNLMGQTDKVDNVSSDGSMSPPKRIVIKGVKAKDD